MNDKPNKRESDAETYAGASTGNGRPKGRQPQEPGYDKKLDGPNRPSV